MPQISPVHISCDIPQAEKADFSFASMHAANPFRHFIFFVFMTFFFVTSVMSTSCAAYAAISSNDFQLIIRTIGFLQNPPKTEIDFVIVFDPQNPESHADAGQLKTFLGEQIKARAMTLNTKLVQVHETSKIVQNSLIFITAGTQAYHDIIQNVANKTKSLSLSLDKNCIENRQCMIYLNSEGRVEIIMDKQAVDDAGYSFRPNFLMMVNMI